MQREIVSERACGGHPGAASRALGGSERGLPELQTYAHRLDEPSRDAWQRPEEVIELLECHPGMTVDLGAGTGYFLRYLSVAVGDEGRVLALDIEPGTIDRLLARIETGLPQSDDSAAIQWFPSSKPPAS